MSDERWQRAEPSKPPGWVRGRKPGEPGTAGGHRAARTSRVDLAEQRVARISERFGRSRVVLSFGSGGGGAFFAQWLRHQIQTWKGLSQPNAVYLDSEGLRNVPNTRFVLKDARMPWIFGWASINEGWRGYYRHAIRQADAMIFIGTAEWSRSGWCRGELRDFRAEVRDRSRQGRKPIKGIAMTLPGCGEPFSGMTEIPCERVWIDPRHKDIWVVKGVVLMRLMSTLGSLN